MPAKKATSASNSASGAEWAKWVYLIGIIVAGLLGAFGGLLHLGSPVAMIISWLLILAGILSGLFFLNSKDVVNFGIRVLLLFAVKEALSPAVIGSFNLGQYFTGFFTGVYDFLLPVGLTLLVVYFWKRYLGSLMP